MTGPVGLEFGVELCDASAELVVTSSEIRIRCGPGCERFAGLVEVVVVEQLASQLIKAG